MTAIEQLAMKKSVKTHSTFPHLQDQVVLYENLLQAMVEAPEKLRDIEQVMKKVQDKNIIPEDFEHLYHIFMEAAKKVNKG